MSDLELERKCTRCGAQNGSASVQCRLCGSRKLEVEPALALAPTLYFTPETRRPEYRPHSAAVPVPSFSTFSLNTLFIAVTLCAVCFGLLRQAPFAAIAAALTGLPALMITYGYLNRFGVHRNETTIGHRFERFFASLMIFWANWLLLVLGIVAVLLVLLAL